MDRLSFCLTGPSPRAGLLFPFVPTLRSHLGGMVDWVHDPLDADVIVTYCHPRVPLEAAKRYKYCLFIPRNWNLGGRVKHRFYEPETIRMGARIDFGPLLRSSRFGPMVRPLPEGDPRAPVDSLLNACEEWLRDIWTEAKESAQQRRDAFCEIEHWPAPFQGRRVAVISSRLEMLRLAEAELNSKNTVRFFLSYRAAFRALKQEPFDFVFCESSMPWEAPSITDLSECDQDFEPIGSDVQIGGEVVKLALDSRVLAVYVVGDPDSGVRDEDNFNNTRICQYGRPIHWDMSNVFSWADVYRAFN